MKIEHRKLTRGARLRWTLLRLNSRFPFRLFQWLTDKWPVEPDDYPFVIDLEGKSPTEVFEEMALNARR